jgi:hypothetical protein
LSAFSFFGAFRVLIVLVAVVPPGRLRNFLETQNGNKMLRLRKAGSIPHPQFEGFNLPAERGKLVGWRLWEQGQQMLELKNQLNIVTPRHSDQFSSR